MGKPSRAMPVGGGLNARGAFAGAKLAFQRGLQLRARVFTAIAVEVRTVPEERQDIHPSDKLADRVPARKGTDGLLEEQIVVVGLGVRGHWALHGAGESRNCHRPGK